MGRAVLDAARQDPQHPHHAEAIKPDAFPYLTDELTLVSKDGLHWETRSARLAELLPTWHPA